MDLILVVIVILLLFGGGLGYSRWGYQGGIGIGGILLIALVIYLLVGRGRL
jgi:Sec-independent protein translocase protein TatA